MMYAASPEGESVSEIAGPDEHQTANGDAQSLMTWLRAQLDDDERVAREADPEPTAEDLEFDDRTSAWTDPHGEFQGRGGSVFAHVLRHSPARVLAEVDAKRRILDEHAPEKHPTGVRCSVCAEGPYYDATWYDAPCPTVRLLALPYTDRPGYREEWKP